MQRYRQFCLEQISRSDGVEVPEELTTVPDDLFVLTDEAPWLTHEKLIRIRQNAIEEVNKALKNPRGHPCALKWRIRIIGKKGSPEDKSDVER